TVTDSIGSGWFAEAATVACMDVYFQAARPTPTETTATSSRKDPIQLRRFMRDALPNASLAYSWTWMNGDPVSRGRACPPARGAPERHGLVQGARFPAPSRARAHRLRRRPLRRRQAAGRPARCAGEG